MDSIPRWTRDNDKCFELALLQFPPGSMCFLENIALLLHKPFDEVKYYYEALVYDLELIESGEFVLPEYPEDHYYVSPTEPTSSKKRARKGIPWSPEEHMLFLDGLEKYGKGDWKSISRECVKTRSPMQVASHAQKYFIRQKPDTKKGKRLSIHDTTLGDAENVTVPASNLKSMGQQPHSGDQIPPNQYYNYSQDNFGLCDCDDECLQSFEKLYK